MSLPTLPGTPSRVSKVTFSPLSGSSEEDKVFVVSIKSVEPKVEDIISMEKTKKIPETKRRPRSSRSFSDKTANKSTMTETPEEASSSPSPQVSEGVSKNETNSKGASASSGPCLKHAAQNISRKASCLPSERISLCTDCSKSMVSYIFLVQDFLDSLASEICGGDGSSNCAQCLRRQSWETAGSETAATQEKRHNKSRGSTSRGNTSHKSENSEFPDGSTPTSVAKAPSHRSLARETRRYEETSEQLIQRTLDSQSVAHQQGPQRDRDEAKHLHENRDPHDKQHKNAHHSSLGDVPASTSGDGKHHPETNVESDSQPHTTNKYGDVGSQSQYRDTSSQPQYGGGSSKNKDDPRQQICDHSQVLGDDTQDSYFKNKMDRQQPKCTDSEDQAGFHSIANVSSPFSDNIDHITTTLSNVEREVYDSARKNAGWDTLSESQERLVSSATGQIPSEAFVTMCRNNAEALGCLVVGTSLLLNRTTRTTCVLISDGVSNAFRGPLSSVFHVVQCVRSMDSLGTTKLSLLEQPELGISFEKLNVWRLTQFNKCVYLNPDTLVVQNCDELFCHEELSAVADIGWPDCFNSGVFVFVPSQKTFWQLLEFSEKQGSYDGGDQGLLNSYFRSWSSVIDKKLSFVYNLMANVSYTYTPAFRQFGRSVKIVQFHGSFKPWHVKFYSRTGQISPSSPVHPTYVQFVHIWLNIFRISALRQLTKDVQSYAQSQEVICAVELLRFFPLPTESEAEFYLTPPSVRVSLAERKMQQGTGSHLMQASQRRKSAELPRYSAQEDDVFENVDKERNIPDEVSVAKTQSSGKEGNDSESMREAESSTSKEKEEGNTEATGDAEGSRKKPSKQSLLPGSEIGNYQGMKAWEQGKMDYEGAASSDNILKRLEFIMAQPKV